MVLMASLDGEGKKGVFFKIGDHFLLGERSESFGDPLIGFGGHYYPKNGLCHGFITHIFEIGGHFNSGMGRRASGTL